MIKKKKFSLFHFVNGMLLVLITVVMIYPFINVVAVSFSDYGAYLENPLMIIPKNFTLDAFKYVISQPLLLSSYVNTIIVTVVGTVLGVLLTMLTAYPLSTKVIKGKGIIMKLITFTMFFNGGLIPNYFLIKNLGLIDSLWALILPGALTAFNIILMKNFFESIPDSLKEAAAIDGANDLTVLFKIVVPLSKPIIATLTLFIAVVYWNNFFNAVVYIRSTNKWTLQLVLREIIMASSAQQLSSAGNYAEMGKNVQTESIKYANLLVAMVPIMCVYPFLQKHFAKGVMIGAVKG